MVGCGHWGPNLVRVFSGLPGVSVPLACDPDPAARARLAAAFPRVRAVANLEPLLEGVDAVAVATPASSHAVVATRCLEAGRHVLVEKPVGVTPAEVASLCDLAQAKKRLLMGGHVFLHHPAVRAVRVLLAEGRLGRLRHVRCLRVNPGPVRHDVSVVEDLLPHDLSMLWLWLDGREPSGFEAVAAHPLGTPRADSVFATLTWDDGLVAQLTASWVEPAKVRQVVLVGERGAVEFDDLDLRRPLRFVRSPLSEERYYQSFGEFQWALGEGPAEHLPVAGREPLVEECSEFVRRSAAGEWGPGPEIGPVSRWLAALGNAIRPRT